MKKLLTCALLALSSIAFGATTVPVQLLNPTGSSSGQAIVSTGASSAPAWGGIGVNGIAAITANTVLANATGSSASPTAFAMPSCTTALEWVSGTGFVCNTAGAFTTLSASGLISPTSTIGIKGTVTNDNAQAGSVGEFTSSSIPTGSAVSLTTSTYANVTSVSLTAGDWDCRGNVIYNVSVGASQLQAGISTTSATLPTLPAAGGFAQQAATTASINGGALALAPTRVSLSSSGTVYLLGFASFASGTVSAYGFLGCRRPR